MLSGATDHSKRNKYSVANTNGGDRALCPKQLEIYVHVHSSPQA